MGRLTPDGERLPPALAQEMLRTFRQYFMPERRDWQNIGPVIPTWFRARLRRIDPQLVLQYIPPVTTHPDGVNAVLFPRGVVALCRRLHRTRLLHKTWVLSLADEQGRYQAPTPGLVRLLIYARNQWKRGGGQRLHKYFDQTMQIALSDRRREDRDRLLCSIAETMRRTGMTSYPERTRAFFPSRN
jgi:hypothetical protein